MFSYYLIIRFATRSWYGECVQCEQFKLRLERPGRELPNYYGCKCCQFLFNDCLINSFIIHNFNFLQYNCRTDQCDKIKKSGCTRIPRFSTPRLSYEKKPLGSTGKADNAAYLNANKDIVAGYFMETGTCIEDSHCEQPSDQCFMNSCESGTCAMENWCETRKNVCGSGKGWVEIDVLLDKWPQEVKWSLEKNKDGVISMQGSNDDINMPLGTKEYNIRNFDSNDRYVCLDNGNYKFTINDSYGDGLASPGYYKIMYEGMEEVINSMIIGNYASSATHFFILGPPVSSTISPTASVSFFL